MIVQPALIIIHILRLLIEHEQASGKFEHIVGGTCLILASRRKSVLIERCRLGCKAFCIVRGPGSCHTSDTVHIIACDHFPEVVGNVKVFRSIRVPVNLERTYYLRYVLIGVQAP